MDKLFERRVRFSTYPEAAETVKSCGGWIAHILKNDDNTFSIMTHINCEWCDYCDQRNEAWRLGLRYDDCTYPLVHEAKPDPYENQEN